MEIPRTITKKELCSIFGLISPSGRTIYYNKLRDLYFTPAVLDRLGITQAQYNALQGGKPFSYRHTKAILAEFDISPDEYRANCGRIVGVL